VAKSTSRASEFEKALEGLYFEKSRFGAKKWPLYWVEVDRIRDALEKLQAGSNSDVGLKMNRLEMIDAMELDEGMVLTYLISSYAHSERVAIRISLALFSEGTKPKIPSVTPFFAQARDFENELDQMFGLKFVKAKRENRSERVSPMILTDDFKGFPMRKSFRGTNSDFKSESSESLAEGSPLEG
jgi:NADH:ubiquinone oxidoreductase subunit C